MKALTKTVQRPVSNGRKMTPQTMATAAFREARERKVEESKKQFTDLEQTMNRIYAFDGGHYSEMMGYYGEELRIVKWSESDGVFCNEKIHELDGFTHWARAVEMFEEGIFFDEECDQGARADYFRHVAAQFA